MISTAKLARLGLVILSLVLSLAHFGPLGGSLVALLLTVGAQVYLFGFLAARALGLLRETENEIVRLIWIVVCGLGFTIVAGAVARLAQLPVSLYVVGLHVAMLVLCFAPGTAAPVARISRRSLALYILLALICVMFAWVGWERNHFWVGGYEDQSLPVSLSDWWAHTALPESLVTREIGQTNTLTYWSTDGLTYVLAAWQWAGDVSAVQLIWYAITPLFAWLVPLAHFAVVYRVTRREDTATWAAGFISILALTTITRPGLYADAWNFGQEAAFQLSTLRTFSTALLVPLTFFVFFSSLRQPLRRHYLMSAVIIFALALTHPRQFLTVFAGLYAILGVVWVMQPSRARLGQSVLLALALLPALLVPVWQYTAQVNSALQPETVSDVAALAGTTTVLLEYQELLFHPLVSMGLLLSPIAILRIRRSLAAQYAVAAILIMLVVSFVPPLFNAILRIMGSYFGLHLVLEFFYIVPYGMILGIAVAFLHDLLADRLPSARVIGNWLVAGGFAFVGLAQLTEPFPITRSARDQIADANLNQSYRDVQPFDQQMLQHLRALPVTHEKMVYLTSNRVASYVIESVPGAFVTGGRPETNPGYNGSTRFFEAYDAPWLDADDITYLQTFPVDYLVIPADNTRIPQMLLQPERFELVESVGGNLVFRLVEAGSVTPDDDRFAQMNALYASTTTPRWEADGFHLDRDGDAALWQPLIEAWQARLADAPSDDLARYGLAFAHLMAGDDQPDEWQSLSDAHPENFLFTEAYTQLLYRQGREQDAADLLVNRLASDRADVRTLAARMLLTEPYFHLLTPESADAILALEADDPATWSHLMAWDRSDAIRIGMEVLKPNADQVRMRAALMMSAGRLDVAERWLTQIPDIEMNARDLVARAALAQVRGDTDTVAALLRPVGDIDWIEPRYRFHRSNWPEYPNAAMRYRDSLQAPAERQLSPTLLAETGALFVLQPEAVQQGSTLEVSAVVGDFTPALSPQRLVVRVTSPDGTAEYVQAETALEVAPGALVPVTVPVDLPPGLAAGAPLRVIIEPRYSDAVVYPSAQANVTLTGATGA